MLMKDENQCKKEMKYIKVSMLVIIAHFGGS